MDPETYGEKLETINGANEAGHLDLNNWEVNFLNSVFFMTGPELSQKQKATIDRIYDKV